jgi:hypothetical protein
MGTGLHGENGLDPEKSISLLKNYILPIVTYGLEIVMPKGKILNDIQNYYKKVLKQLLSLTINVADPAVYMISGLLPLEFLCALVILPNIVKTLLCISASRGNSPDIMYTAGSATFIVRDNNCFKTFL